MRNDKRERERERERERILQTWLRAYSSCPSSSDFSPNRALDTLSSEATFTATSSSSTSTTSSSRGGDGDPGKLRKGRPVIDRRVVLAHAAAEKTRLHKLIEPMEACSGGLGGCGCGGDRGGRGGRGGGSCRSQSLLCLVEVRRCIRAGREAVGKATSSCHRRSRDSGHVIADRLLMREVEREKER